MAQRELSLEEVREVVGRVHYEKRFEAHEWDGVGFYVQIVYDEPDIRDGQMTEQRGRKWYVSRYATDSEIVQTCLTAALASAEHQVREHFGYMAPGNRPGTRPRLIYGPHFSANFLFAAMRAQDNAGVEVFDAREDPA